MQSVSPSSSTYDSPDWSQTFEAVLNEEVSSSEMFKMDLSINGTPMGADWYPMGDVGKKIVWSVDAGIIELYGYQLQVGDRIAICSISRKVDDEWVEVWTA